MYDGFFNAIEMKDHKESQAVMRDYVGMARTCDVDFHHRRDRRDSVPESSGGELTARIHLDGHPGNSAVREFHELNDGVRWSEFGWTGDFKCREGNADHWFQRSHSLDGQLVDRFVPCDESSSGTRHDPIGSRRPESNTEFDHCRPAFLCLLNKHPSKGTLRYDCIRVVGSLSGERLVERTLAPDRSWKTESSEVESAFPPDRL